MKISFVLLFLTVSTSCINSFADPGCLKAIQGKAINERAAKLLPSDCQEFRKSYLKGLHLLSKNPKEFSREFSKQIKSRTSFEAPYDAILISTFTKNISSELKSAIQQRAKIETAKKVKYQYGVAALERMNQGDCSSLFSAQAYDEICRGKDLVYERIGARK